ncbi:hypothetical protein [Burkholderia pseudomallei]|uniref:hypothetical protein n=1 Tax=Burkholderia pseudomallei TaxID=28450 RepID=UPI001651297F|nr:hypothetical protein [Burkholderia pseudomallei]
MRVTVHQQTFAGVVFVAETAQNREPPTPGTPIVATIATQQSANVPRIETVVYVVDIKRLSIAVTFLRHFIFFGFLASGAVRYSPIRNK